MASRKEICKIRSKIRNNKIGKRDNKQHEKNLCRKDRGSFHKY